MTDHEAHDELNAMEPTDEDFAQSMGKDKRKIEDRYVLIQATRRLLDRMPEDLELKALLTTQDWLPITKFTVEKESGIDRRLFSGSASDQPDISDLLKRLKPTRGVAKTTTELVNKQAKKIDVLEQRLTAAWSAMAAQITRISALTVQLQRANAQIKRLKAGQSEED